MTALQNTVQYVGSVEWAAVPAYPGAGAVAAGTLCTNTANVPGVGNERVFVAITSGSTLGTAPMFGTTKGVITADTSSVSFNWQEITGQPGVNGDTTNSPQWAASTATVLGEIIYDPTSASLQIISARTGNTGATKPTFSATAGVTTSDNAGAVTWTSIGLASSFGAFAAPHARVLNADAPTWQAVVPATIYVASDHAETAAATTTLAGGSAGQATANKYLSISKTTVPPTALTAGASVSTTGAFTLTVTGWGYWYGFTFSSGTGSTLETMDIEGSSRSMTLDTCTFKQGTTGAGTAFLLSSVGAGAYSLFINPTFNFGATTQNIGFGGWGTVINPTLSGSTPTTLFSGGAVGGIFTIRDADLSAITGTLFAASASSGQVLVENCKIAAGVTMTSGSFVSNQRFKLHNCDSGTKNYRFYEADAYGTIQQETTIVDNTNPASNGTTSISWNIATTASAAFGQPFNAPEIAQWCALTTGSHTATIQINSNIALTNAQIWLELEYLGSSATPIGTVVTTRPATILTMPTTYATSTDSWGGSESSQQYMQVTFSPAMAGYIKARIFVADPSITVYVNPLIQVV